MSLFYSLPSDGRSTWRTWPFHVLSPLVTVTPQPWHEELAPARDFPFPPWFFPAGMFTASFSGFCPPLQLLLSHLLLEPEATAVVIAYCGAQHGYSRSITIRLHYVVSIFSAQFFSIAIKHRVSLCDFPNALLFERLYLLERGAALRFEGDTGALFTSTPLAPWARCLSTASIVQT
jgi:hypothetical protein